MIKLTRLNGSELYINPALIEVLEETPDTHILLTNGNRYLVLEPARVVIERMVALQSRIMRRTMSSESKKYLMRKSAESFRPYCRLEKEKQPQHLPE